MVARSSPNIALTKAIYIVQSKMNLVDDDEESNVYVIMSTIQFIVMNDSTIEYRLPVPMCNFRQRTVNRKKRVTNHHDECPGKSQFLLSVFGRLEGSSRRLS